MIGSKQTNYLNPSKREAIIFKAKTKKVTKHLNFRLSDHFRSLFVQCHISFQLLPSTYIYILLVCVGSYGYIYIYI